MKLTKNTLINTSLLTSALLLLGAAYAASVDNNSLATQSKNCGLGISELMIPPTEEYCAFDVRYAATILKNVAFLLHSHQFDLAKSDLSFALRTLERVHDNKQDCVYLSVKVFPYIAKTKDLIHQLVSKPTGFAYS